MMKKLLVVRNDKLGDLILIFPGVTTFPLDPIHWYLQLFSNEETSL